jgi:hypothetical protein
MGLSLVWPTSAVRLQGDQLDPGFLSPDDPDAGSGQAKIVGQGRYNLPVGLSLFRRSHHAHSILGLAELLNAGLPGTGMGPDCQEPLAGLALAIHLTTHLSSKTHGHAPEHPVGVEGEGIDQKVID